MKLHIISNDAFELEMQEYLCICGEEVLKNEIRKKMKPRKFVSYCWLEDIKSWAFSFDRKYIEAQLRGETTKNSDLRCLIISEDDWNRWIEDGEDLEAFRLSKGVVRNYTECYSEEVFDLRHIYPYSQELTVFKYLTLEV